MELKLTAGHKHEHQKEWRVLRRKLEGRVTRTMSNSEETTCERIWTRMLKVLWNKFSVSARLFLQDCVHVQVPNPCMIFFGRSQNLRETTEAGPQVQIFPTI